MISAGKAFNPEICLSNCTKLTHFKPVYCHILTCKSTKIACFKIMFFNQPFLQLNFDRSLPNSQSGALSGSNQDRLSTVSITYHRSKHRLTTSSTIPPIRAFPGSRFSYFANSGSVNGSAGTRSIETPGVSAPASERTTLNSETIEFSGYITIKSLIVLHGLLFPCIRNLLLDRN
jgi:hypothetical protein